MAKAATTAISTGVSHEPVTVVTTPEGVRLSFRSANFATRLGAFVIDIVIMALIPIVALIVYAILPFENMDLTQSSDHPVYQFGIIVLLLIFFFARSGYFMFFEMGPRAATPGKRLLKIRVISHDGGHLTPSAVITRNALREVEFFLPLGFMFQVTFGGGWLALTAFVWTLILALFPLFNSSKARLGDFLGGTRVVHMPKEVLSFDLVDEAAVAGTILFTPEQIAVYGEKELGVLEDVLRERRPATLKAVADKIKARIGWVEPSNPLDIPNDETFLRAYYAGLRAHLEGRMLLGRRRKDKFDKG